jgi:hypothetical protein
MFIAKSWCNEVEAASRLHVCVMNLDALCVCVFATNATCVTCSVLMLQSRAGMPLLMRLFSQASCIMQASSSSRFDCLSILQTCLCCCCCRCTRFMCIAGERHRRLPQGALWSCKVRHCAGRRGRMSACTRMQKRTLQCSAAADTAQPM